MRAVASPRPAAGAVAAARTARFPRRLRLWLLTALVLAAPLAAGYHFWLKDSRYVWVEDVTVTGLTTTQAADIRGRLTAAAREMTTLDVDVKALERAVASYPIVAGIEVDPHLPHGLTVEVTEHRAVAAIEGPAGHQVAVAADGTVLTRVSAGEELAEVPGVRAPASGRVQDPDAVRAVQALAAAPPPLAELAERLVRRPGQGLMVTLDQGPDIVLGDDSRLDAKWAAAAAALGEGGAADAAYVDVSLPERPAAGG